MLLMVLMLAAMPVLVTNCIPVNKAHAIDFEDRFVHRINHVDQAPGFIRNEVLRPSLTTFDHATGEWRLAKQEDPSAVYRIATLWETMDGRLKCSRSLIPEPGSRTSRASGSSTHLR